MLSMHDLTGFITQEKAMNEQKYYSAQEVADRYNVDSTTIRRWIRHKAFPGAIKKNPMNPRSHYIIPQSAIDYFEEKRKAASEN